MAVQLVGNPAGIIARCLGCVLPSAFFSASRLCPPITVIRHIICTLYLDMGTKTGILTHAAPVGPPVRLPTRHVLYARAISPHFPNQSWRDCAAQSFGPRKRVRGRGDGIPLQNSRQQRLTAMQVFVPAPGVQLLAHRSVRNAPNATAGTGERRSRRTASA
jgi:hypothetical protein